MDPKDKKAIESAIAIVGNLDGQLANVMKRGANAAKFWANEANKDYQADNKKVLKGELVPAMLEVVKRAKAAQKDLYALEKEGSDGKRLAAYADGKAFRVKATKLLGASKDFDDASAKLTLVLLKFKGMHPGMNDADVKATLGYLENFRKYYTAIRVELARL